MTMGDRIKRTAQDVKGKAKETAGKVTDDPGLQAEGRGDQATADARRAADKAGDALVAIGLADSRNAARRTIGEGGASLNNVKLADPEYVLAEEDFLHGHAAVLKRGRRNLAAARR